MGGNRFQTPEEIRELLTDWQEGMPGGPLLWMEHGKKYVYSGECQTLVIGSTGSGKSRHCSQPTVRFLAQAGENMIIADPKGELARRHRQELKRQGYKVTTINLKDLNDPERSGWNPLAYPRECYLSSDPIQRNYAFELIGNLAHSIYPDEDSKDIFWVNSARSIFSGCCFALFEIAPAEQVTLESVHQMVSAGSQRHGMSNYLSELAATLPPGSAAAMQLQPFTSCSATDTRAGMISTLLTGLSPYSNSEELMSMLAHDEVRIQEMDGTQKIAIFIIFPDSTSTYDALAGVAIQSITQHLIHVADRYPNGKLPIRHNIIIEELGSIGKSIDLPNLFMAGRSRNLRLLCILQSLFSLDALYGQAQAAAIRSSADLTICMRCNNLQTMKEIAELCGEREIKCGPNQYASMPLIRPTELQQFQTGQALVMLKGKKFITNLPSVDELFPEDLLSQPLTPTQPQHTSSRPAFFDIKEYLSEWKHQPEKMPVDVKVDCKETADPSEPDLLISPRDPLPPSSFSAMTDDMITRLRKKMAVMEAHQEGAIQDLTSPISLVLCKEQDCTKEQMFRTLRKLLHFPRDLAKRAVCVRPFILLHKLHKHVAEELIRRFSAENVRVAITADAPDFLPHASGNYSVLLLKQDPDALAAALVGTKSFSPASATKISKSLPCVIAKNLQHDTAEHFVTALENASVSCFADSPDPEDIVAG